jgi:hypothetical protein
VAKYYGGFLIADNLSILIECYDVMNNSADWGGAFYIGDTSFASRGSGSMAPNNVESNHITGLRVFLFGVNSTILIAHSNFYKNEAGWGGAIYIHFSNLTIVGDKNDPTNLQRVIFENNTAINGGGFFYGAASPNLTAIVGNLLFRSNKAPVRYPYTNLILTLRNRTHAMLSFLVVILVKNLDNASISTKNDDNRLCHIVWWSNICTGGRYSDNDDTLS